MNPEPFLKKACVKWVRQQRLQPMRGLLGREIGEDDFEIAAKFPQDLPARTAWRGERGRVGDDRDGREDAMAFRDRLEHRDAFRADRQAVGGVLDVAAGDDRTVGGFERRTDLEIGESGVGILARASSGRHEILFDAASARTARALPAIAFAPIALWPADVLGSPVESEPAGGLHDLAAIIEQQAHRTGSPDAADDMRDARDLVQPAGQGMRIRIGGKRLGGIRICQVPNQWERVRPRRSPPSWGMTGPRRRSQVAKPWSGSRGGAGPPAARFVMHETPSTSR